MSKLSYKLISYSKAIQAYAAGIQDGHANYGHVAQDGKVEFYFSLGVMDL
ncbi:hypothetical protein [Paenibacillus glycanilyticus]